MNAKIKATAIAVAVAAVFSAGWLASNWYNRAPVIATPAPEKRQSDGSLVLKRDPGAVIAAPSPKLPAKPKRTAVVRVKPKPAPVKPDPDGACPAVVECPAVTVRIDEADGRLIASSPDGEIVDGIDKPISLVAPRKTPWAVGATYTHDGHYGGFIDRDVGPLRVGLEADRDAVRVRVGIRF